MTKSAIDPFGARSAIDTALGRRTIYRLDALEPFGDIATLPYCIKVLLEACLRHCDGRIVSEADVQAIAAYDAGNVGTVEVPFRPGRIILQDFTGVPAVVDLAAVRDALVNLTGNAASARRVNPRVPCDLIVDHSVQVDAFASPAALSINSRKEFERNQERYRFLKWGQGAFENFSVVPPATGIVHQVNLEYLAKVVWDAGPEEGLLYPDSLLGTDSHTTMINGLGVLGWGVGGIEAEAVMLGQPVYLLLPDVVGVRFTGTLPAGATATDLVLRVTELLREFGVVGRFVEFFGEGLARMPLADRATVANMAPEYGATIGFFPVDQQTVKYLALTGRPAELIETVEQYCKLQGLWRDESRPVRYTDVVELDLSSVEASLAGPQRPQDRIALGEMKPRWRSDLVGVFNREAGEDRPDGAEVEYAGQRFALGHGDVCIASITSCTNTSNPSVLIAAGLLARNAGRLGLQRKPWVKSSLAPGSKVVTEYLRAAGLLPHLENLGFHVVGYGCTTCIGNSGPLPEPISKAINEHDLVAASVLSGNRNFEGRINPDVLANYLASPPLVVAYALAGTVDIDLTSEPLGVGTDGQAVFLKDIWPARPEIDALVAEFVTRDQFIEQYANVLEGSEQWRAIGAADSELYPWDQSSTYIRKPPFFENLTPDPTIGPISGARVLCKFGDSVTTDHISPAGAIAADSPAGRYLIECGVPVSEFNSFGSRRGNDRVMTRGTFGNARIRNQLAPGTEGGWTKYLGAKHAAPEGGDRTSIYDAAMKYRAEGIPVLVLAGRDYGMGSSRDWAAKGTFLLGVRAVIAESFERIHRSNLVGMGVLPLTFRPGESAASLGLDGTEIYEIAVDDSLQPRQDVSVKANRTNGEVVEFTTTCRVDTPVEVDYYRNGGILHTVLRAMAADESD